MVGVFTASIKLSGDPLVNVAGAYFPAWLAAGLLGLAGTLALWGVANRLRCGILFQPGLVMVPAWYVACSGMTWLLFFGAR